MGYKRKQRIYQLQWPEGDDLSGLIVTARGMRLGELLKLGLMVDEVKTQEKESSGVAEITELIAKFAEVLVEWNFEDDNDQPVPATAEGLNQLELPEVLSVLEAYIDAAVGVDDPLPEGSPNGKPSPVELPPMDEL